MLLIFKVNCPQKIHLYRVTKKLCTCVQLINVRTLMYSNFSYYKERTKWRCSLYGSESWNTIKADFRLMWTSESSEAHILWTLVWWCIWILTLLQRVSVYVIPLFNRLQMYTFERLVFFSDLYAIGISKGSLPFTLIFISWFRICLMSITDEFV